MLDTSPVPDGETVLVNPFIRTERLKTNNSDTSNVQLLFPTLAILR